MTTTKSEQDRMFQLVERWHQSSTDLVSFCQLYKLSPSGFQTWIDQFFENRKAKTTTPNFIEVPAPSTTGLSEPSESVEDTSVILEVVLPSGAVLRFSQLPELNYLQTLLQC